MRLVITTPMAVVADLTGWCTCAPKMRPGPSGYSNITMNS